MLKPVEATPRTVISATNAASEKSCFEGWTLSQSKAIFAFQLEALSQPAESASADACTLRSTTCRRSRSTPDLSI
eukprot:320020-Ditylum_brightwellii.AAC.1